MSAMGLRIIDGLIVRTNPNMVTTKFETVDRTWMERLFSWPWRPFKRTKTIKHVIPLDEAYKMPDGSLVMHPEMLKTLKAYIAGD